VLADDPKLCGRPLLEHREANERLLDHQPAGLADRLTRRLALPAADRR
jgi:hypothetical protein